MAVEYVPGLAGVPAAKSKIGLIDGNTGKLWYRGYSVDELAEYSDYEEVAFLLLRGSLPNAADLADFKSQQRRHRPLEGGVVDLLRRLPSQGRPMEAMVATVAAIGLYYPDVRIGDPNQRWDAAVQLTCKVPAIVAAYHRIRCGEEPLPPRDDLSHAANFLWQLNGAVPDPLLARVMDACLVVHAEHGMNASTFAARVTASTLADPYAVIASAVATLAGPLHGGANEDVLATLRAIPGGVDGVRAWAERGVADDRKFAGFGHRVYKVKDPRAKILQKLAAQLFQRFGTTPLYDVACELEKVLGEHIGAKGVYPNVDFYSGIVYEKMGIPTDLLTPMFAVARTVGWLAHWLEQVENNRMFRPTQIYEGERGLRYVPIEQRS